MTKIYFDTLAYKIKLRDAGVTDEMASAMTSALHDAFIDAFAKPDTPTPLTLQTDIYRINTKIDKIYVMLAILIGLNMIVFIKQFL